MNAFLAALALLIGSVAGVSAALASCERVVASAHPDYPPYHWREGGRIVGASVDLNRMIFKEIGVEFEAIYTGPWKRVLKTAENGGVDFLMSLKKTSERATYLDYTDNPTFENPFTVFTLTSNRFPLAGWEDLTEKRGAKNAGDRYGEPFDSFVAKTLKLSDNFSLQDNVNRLLVGRIDYIIHGRFVGKAQFGMIEGGANIKPLDHNVVEGFVHSGFAKSSGCTHLLEHVDRRYRELLEDGTADRLLLESVDRWVAASTNYDLRYKLSGPD